MPKIIVLKDDREKVGYTQTTLGAAFTIQTTRLETGDYTIKGMKDIFVIEKKASWNEISIDFTNKYIKNTDAAFRRLAAIPYHIVLIHDTIQGMRNVYSPRGPIEQSRIMYMYTQMLFVYKLRVQLVGKSGNEAFIRRIFTDMHRLRKDGRI